MWQYINCSKVVKVEVKSTIANSVESPTIWLYGQLSTACSNATEVTHWATPSCSRPWLATYNGVREDRFNWLAVTPHPHQQYTLSVSYTVQISAASARNRPCNFLCAMHPPFLYGHSFYISHDGGGDGGGNGVLIRSTVSDAMVRSWLWSTATKSCPLGSLSSMTATNIISNVDIYEATHFYLIELLMLLYYVVLFEHRPNVLKIQL